MPGGNAYSNAIRRNPKWFLSFIRLSLPVTGATATVLAAPRPCDCIYPKHFNAQRWRIFGLSTLRLPQTGLGPSVAVPSLSISSSSCSINCNSSGISRGYSSGTCIGRVFRVVIWDASCQISPSKKGSRGLGDGLRVHPRDLGGSAQWMSIWNSLISTITFLNIPG